MLHITDGESVAGTLRESGAPGIVTIYGDLLYEGPAPAGLSSEAWRETRARYLSETGHLTLEEARRYLETFEDTLAAIPNHGETVLWLDYRLSDQLILIKLLDWFSRRNPGRAKLSLICVGSFAGVDDFAGLGQLTANQLTSLADTRVEVSAAQFRVARAAWDAFTSADPTAIERVIETGVSALPFLAAALRRHLEQFPSVDNGLSRTEHQALSVLRERGSLPGRRLFLAVQRMEEPLFMGDLSFLRILIDLASARHPLIHTGDARPVPGDGARTFETISPVAISEHGLRVFEGRDDHIRLNGIDRWLGGTHLQESSAAAWRWNRADARLARTE
jgi:hypothetical protein